MNTTPGFDPQQAFNAAFLDQIDREPAGAEWMTSGRSSKDWPEGETEEWWLDAGPKMVQRWMDWRDATPWDIWVTPTGVPAIELELLVDLDGERVKVIIDRLMATAPDNERPIVVDVKSGSKLPKALLQLGIGAAAVETAYPGVRVAGGCFWMARTGANTPVQPLGMFTPSYIGALMRRHRRATAAGIYLPNVGDFCKSCSVGEYCAANNGAKARLDPDYELMRHR